jgi:hypothetical protein
MLQTEARQAASMYGTMPTLYTFALSGPNKQRTMVQGAASSHHPNSLKLKIAVTQVAGSMNATKTSQF